jgi:cysteine desulfurase
MLRDSTRLQPLRDLMEEKFLNEISGALVNGRKDRLPHVLNISFPDTDNEQLLLSLSKYLAMSRGSACSSNTQKPSHVLKAMGLTDEQAGHAIRISLGRFNTAEEVLFATDVIKKAVQKKRTAFAE